MSVQPTVGHMYVQAIIKLISLDICMSNTYLYVGWTDVCPTPNSRLKICMSKLTTEVGHTIVQPYGFIGSLDIRISNPCCQLGHTYVQPGHTYVQADYAFRHIRL